MKFMKNNMWLGSTPNAETSYTLTLISDSQCTPCFVQVNKESGTTFFLYSATKQSTSSLLSPTRRQILLMAKIYFPLVMLRWKICHTVSSGTRRLAVCKRTIWGGGVTRARGWRLWFARREESSVWLLSALMNPLNFFMRGVAPAITNNYGSTQIVGILGIFWPFGAENCMSSWDGGADRVLKSLGLYGYC